MLLKAQFDSVAGEQAYWIALDPVTHSGYRLLFYQAEEGYWLSRIERWDAGVMTTRDEGEGRAHPFEEGIETVEFSLVEHFLRVALDGFTYVYGIEDTKYSKGYIGIEAPAGAGANGTTKLTVDGAELDDFERSENPLASPENWVVLPWVADTGKCQAGLGWTRRGVTSGAFWSGIEFEEGKEEEEEHKEEHGSLVRSGVVKRPVD